MPKFGEKDGKLLLQDGTTDKSVFCETTPLSPRSDSLGAKEAECLRKGVLALSWISVITLVCLGISTLVLGVLSDSSAAFAFALDALLDVLSSFVVIWRFISAKGLFSVKRERIACVILGCLFVISSIIIMARSITSLVSLERPTKDPSLTWLFVANAFLCLGLFTAKIYLGVKLCSIVIITDGFNSFIGLVLSVSIVITDFLYETRPKVWVADPTMGILCGISLLLYGIWCCMLYRLVIDKSMKIAKNAPDEATYEKLDCDAGVMETSLTNTDGEPDPDPDKKDDS